MSVIAEFSIPASDFVLGRALQRAPGLSVQIDQVVPTGTATVPYFWVVGTDRARFDEVLEGEPALETFRVVDELDDRALYRVDWNPDAHTIVHLLVDHDVVLQEAGGDEDSWEFLIRFPDSHVLSEFHSACRDAGLDLSVKRLYNPIDPSVVTSADMTDAQRTLIETAYDRGYFDVPRKITLSELSEELGVSDQAVNERMRRGLSALIESTLKSGATAYVD